MQVEVYDATEATTEGRDKFEIDAESQQLITDLGLSGQEKLLRREEGVETGTVIPFNKMTRGERGVYKTLYPEHVDVDAYDAGPIPLRVLQVVAHAQKVDMFDLIHVWGPQTKDPDPLLVGIVGNKYHGDFYLLARWGDALEPFEELYKRAFEVVKRDWKQKAESVMHQVKAFLAAPDHPVAKKLSGEFVSTPWT